MSEAGEVPEGEVIDRDWEAEARTMGWHPLEEFNGDQSKWVEAKTFVMRGETQLPLLQKNNKVLQARARRSEDDNADLRQQMGDMRDSLNTMRGMLQRGEEAGYQRAKAEFEAQMRQAVRNGDEESFDKIQGEMAKLDEHHEKITATPEPKVEPTPKGPKATPEFQAWFADNGDWVKADATLRDYAVTAEKELRQSDDPLSEAEIWENVTAMVQQKFPRRYAAATGSAEPVTPSAGSPEQRRAPSVLRPSGGAPPNTGAKKNSIDSIADPDERKMARAAFNSVKRGIPAYTEAEYMQAYTDPKADSIEPALKRKIANASPR